MELEKPSTRSRILAAAGQLFAHGGYQGASVRDICDLAHTNPGAVSYHFGGKRQLYRAVLRQAAQTLEASLAHAPASPAAPGAPEAGSLSQRIHGLYRALRDNPTPAQLLLRDLADGGAVAVEALAPGLRSALSALHASSELGDTSREASADRLLFLELAAPLFLVTAAWPVLEGVLELESSQREQVAEDLVNRVLARLRPEPPARAE